MNSSLAEKLQLKPEHKIIILNPPVEMLETMQERLPENEITTNVTEPTDAVLFFISTLAEAESLVSHAIETLNPGGLLWVAYPGQNRKKVTDVTRERLAETLQPTGWRAVHQVELDESWSALRFERQEAEV